MPIDYVHREPASLRLKRAITRCLGAFFLVALFVTATFLSNSI